MGIYVFKKDQLVKLLKETYITSNDFGGEIIPAAAADHKVVAYLFNDYWEDIGTIKSFFEANLALAQQVWLRRQDSIKSFLGPLSFLASRKQPSLLLSHFREKTSSHSDTSIVNW